MQRNQSLSVLMVLFRRMLPFNISSLFHPPGHSVCVRSSHTHCPWKVKDVLNEPDVVWRPRSPRRQGTEFRPCHLGHLCGSGEPGGIGRGGSCAFRFVASALMLFVCIERQSGLVRHDNSVTFEVRNNVNGSRVGPVRWWLLCHGSPRRGSLH